MRKQPICSGADPGRVAADLASLVDFQEQPISRQDLSRLIKDKLLPHLMCYDRPSFQSMFNAFPEAGAAFGARIALAYNQGVTNWQVSPGGAVLEELCGRALCRLFGFVPEAEATFMYSGTYANQQALYLALHALAQARGFDLAERGLAGFPDPSGLAVLATEHAHFSLRHAVRMLGLGDRSLLTIGMDDRYRMDVADLERVLDKHGRGRDVVLVLASAGTTSTGAVDPIACIAGVCRSRGLRLHVDGAYGLSFALVPEERPLFEGFDQADSVSWDPHKQMGVPIPSSVLFVRDWRDFSRMAVHADYFNRSRDAEPNPGLKSPPSTRPLSALPLVTSIRSLGLNGVAERLRAPLSAVREAYAYSRTLKDIEVCHKPDSGILCLRASPRALAPEQADALQVEIHRRIQSGGERSISITSLGGRKALRLLAVSPGVTAADLRETIDVIRKTAESIAPFSAAGTSHD
jgi:L-2,4-diaminobutyrate decarboxylase